MAYIRKFGRVDLFFTFTCNPKWLEISNKLFQHQNVSGHHDIISRVFYENQKKLLCLPKERRIFGELNALITTIECRKRGFPHTHALIWCKLKIKGEKMLIKLFQLSCLIKMTIQGFKTQLIHGPCEVSNPDLPCIHDKKALKNIQRLIFRKLRLTLMDILVTAGVNRKMEANQKLREFEDRKLPWIINR